MYLQNPLKRKPRKLLTALSILAAVSLACNLPFISTPSPAPDALTPTAGEKSVAREPLPPVVIETSPLPFAVIPMTGAVSLTFDQPMDRDSVEGAVKVDPAVPGRFEWEGDATVRFVPDQPLAPDTTMTVTVASTARSAGGQNLLRESSFSFQTSSAFTVVERLPKPETIDANPSSTVAVTLNQPVAELGESDTPAAFTLEPEVDGEGYWLNTSTFVFEPDPAMAGGVQYQVRLNPELTSLGGARLTDEISHDWSFTTAPPALLEVQPAAATTIMLDEKFQLTFNQPMDTISVEQAFSLRDAAGNLVSGKFNWAERDTVVTYQPDELLLRGNSYFMEISRAARSRGGTELLISTRMEYRSVGGFSVSGTQPVQGYPLKVYSGFGSIVFKFTAPLAEGQDLSRLVGIEPRPGNYAVNRSADRLSIFLTGSFLEATNYHVTLDASLQDKWGGTLEETYAANFLVSDSEPALSIPILSHGSYVLFARPGDSTLPAYATNLSTLNLTRVSLNLQQFLEMVYKFDAPAPKYFSPQERWDQSLTLPRNLSQGIDIDLTPGDGELQEGLYIYNLDTPDMEARYEGVNFALVASTLQITIKENQDEVFLWVTNLQTGQPAAGLPVEIYNDAANPAGIGTISADGTARIPLQKKRDNYRGLVVAVGTPGSGAFGVGVSTWTGGISPWNMGIASRTYQEDLKGYIFTDRPIYRPGDTVFFRAVLRGPDDARYNLPSFETAAFQLFGAEREYGSGDLPLLDSVQLELSPYGTVTGEFTLPLDAAPGNYAIQMENQNTRIDFQVAEYRKPEIDVSVNFEQLAYRAGGDIRAQIAAKYYFGGAASNVKVRWTLYSDDEYIHIPGGYATGLVDTSWLKPSWYSRMGFFGSRYLASGEGVTGADGTLDLVFSAADLAGWLDISAAHSLNLQAELVDESSMSVAQHGSTMLHPESFTIGIKPESWLAAAGDSVGFTIQTVDWSVEPVSNKDLSAVFQKIEWVQDWSNIHTGEVSYREQLTEMGSVNFRTDGGGRARIEFTVDQPGTYRLDVRGGQAVSQVLLWAGGAGSVPWPSLPDQNLRLQSDREAYQPGETAKIFIPNPYPQGATALITVERWDVLSHQVLDIKGSSFTFDVDLDDTHAPNVYLSVLLLGRTASGKPDFRIGYLELTVDAQSLLLDVDLAFDHDTLAPGQSARASILVRDSSGKPVQGEFSMAVVDKSIFALAKPNAGDIISEFYGPQPLGVRTSTPLAGYTQRIITQEPAMGGGGGGGGAAPVNDLRENFKDTAFWRGSFETDNAGKAVVEFPVPDNLTTWVVTVRGLTRDTRVGEAVTELLVTKDLIIRPVTPRFMIAGDRIQLGAVVNNNTAADLNVTVELDAVGVSLPSSEAAVAVEVPAGGRIRVNWWVNVQEAGAARLVFSARSGTLQDAATPALGDIPILHYSSPQTFGTSGLMTAEGENLEVVSLPKSFDPTGGELRVEMTSSLAGTVLSGLEALESFPLDFAEPTISHLVANLAGYNLLKESGSSQPDLLARYQKAIREDLDRLPAMQNSNGGFGFGWSRSGKSDLYLSSYALLAMSWATDAGFMLQPNLMPQTQQYVLVNTGIPESTWHDWQLDRLAMVYFALDQSGSSSIQPQDLYPYREKLSPWAKALLALALDSQGDETANTLLSDLQGLAVRSATGVNWQDDKTSDQNFATPNFNTSVVVYALSTKDPASPMLADAVRYLVYHRNAAGSWHSSYDSAWVLTALARYIRGTSELKGDFEYSAVLNGAPLASGSAGSSEPWTLVRASVPVADLDPETGNALRFIRGEGVGRLYYRAFLEVGQPVEQTKPLDRGLTISRDYILAGGNCTTQDCPAIDSISLQAKNPVVIGRVTITVPRGIYYVVIEDAIPAGAELIDLSLGTAVLVFEEPADDRQYDPLDPFAKGWGWWWFGSPTIYDDHIRWVAEYLPAGTYTLTYQLQPQLAGEFRVLPARAYAYYFPEVEGRSAGAIFTIKE